jgi:NADH-ubiquinone oxidoreductase chain 2
MIFFSILILIVAIALPSINNNISSNIYIRISSIILLYSGLLALNAINIPALGSGIGLFSGLFHVTFISQLTDFFIFLIGSLILIAWPLINNIKYNQKLLSNRLTNKINKINIYSTEYSLIILFSTLGGSLLVSSADIVSMYLSIELQSFGVYILSTIFRDSDTATSAGLKYFLLGGLSSCLILLGGGLIYSFTGLTNFEAIYSLISVSDNNYIIQGSNLGFIFMIVGLLFKVAAAPLHNWAPDVYDDSPTIVTIWLTIMPKISILILLLELFTQNIGIEVGLLTANNINGIELINNINISSLNYTNEISNINILNKEWTNYFTEIKILLLISSLLSLILGTIVGLAQTRIKRLLAYSTISHIGFILLALAISTEQSIESLLFYIVQYSITNLNTFLILISLSYLIYNSVLQKYFYSIIKNNKYFTIISIILQTIKPNILYIIFLKMENLFNLFPDFIFRSKNSNIIKLSKEIKKGLIDTDIKFISELKGQFFSNPLLSLSLSICLFSMAGIPPLIGFFSKQFVLYSAVQSGYFFISIIAILVSVISASYYLKIIRVLHETNVNSSIKNSYSTVYNLRKRLLELYANFKNNRDNNNQFLFHDNYFKEMQLIFLLNFIFRFDLMCKSLLNNNLNSSITLSTSTKDIYINKELWQLNMSNYLSLSQNFLNKKRDDMVSQFTSIPKEYELVKIKNSYFFYQLSNFHSFLISNLTLIILLFVLKPSILLSSTRLLSLSIFTY